MSDRIIRPRAKTRKIFHHAHVLVVEKALELTRASYAAIMQNNMFYDDWKRAHPGMGPKALEKAYCKRYVASHIAPARAILANSLSQPIDEDLKRTIHEALIMDNTLTRGRDPKGWSL